MPKSKRLETIYIELDALLDTRLGTISQIDSNLASSVLLSGKYHTREDDVFEGVDVTEYKEMYSKRDTLTLANSLVTDAIFLLKHLVGVLTEQAIQRPYHEGCQIVVNYFPYNLDHAEREEIAKAVTAWVQSLAPVELVRIPPKDLTPDYCKKSYALMIAYEYEDWMNIHAEAFKQTRLPEVTMFVPALYFNKKPTPEELEKTIKTAAHPLRAIEMLASPLIGLRLIDVSNFSIVSNKVRDGKSTSV